MDYDYLKISKKTVVQNLHSMLTCRYRNRNFRKIQVIIESQHSESILHFR